MSGKPESKVLTQLKLDSPYSELVNRLSITSQEVIAYSPVAKIILKQKCDSAYAKREFPDKNTDRGTMSACGKAKLRPKSLKFSSSDTETLKYNPDSGRINIPSSPTQSLEHQSSPSASGIPQDASVEYAGSLPFSFGISSPGKVSPLRGCNLKEYEEQLNHLKKENFSLKVRIYYLEDIMGKKCNFKDDKDNLHKANLELKVESEALKKELYDKQELIRQASALFSTQESKYKDQLDQVKEQYERESDELKARVYILEKEVEDYSEKCLQEGRDLTQLCGLAFSTDGSDDDFGSNSVFAVQGLQNVKPMQLPGMSRSPLQGIFSLPEAEPSLTAEQKSGFRSLESVVPHNPSNRIMELEHQVKDLEKKVTSLEEELKDKERISNALEEDVNNLKRELDDREDKLADLEVEVAEKDQKVDQLMQDLEIRHREIEAKDSTIQTLHDDLNKVEPEIEIKVQEIIERDRIIEEKIEQLQQQNKILVEIQITLDEKQKQIAELEAKILETQQKNEKLSSDVELSCETIKNLACEIMNRDKEIGTLKKELKRKEKKCRDLVAELNEYSDMLKKANWEKETSGGEDGVKEMVEEENEVGINLNVSISKWASPPPPLEEWSCACKEKEQLCDSLQESLIENELLNITEEIEQICLQHNVDNCRICDPVLVTSNVEVSQNENACGFTESMKFSPPTQDLVVSRDYRTPEDDRLHKCQKQLNFDSPQFLSIPSLNYSEPASLQNCCNISAHVYELHDSPVPNVSRVGVPVYNCVYPQISLHEFDNCCSGDKSCCHQSLKQSHSCTNNSFKNCCRVSLNQEHDNCSSHMRPILLHQNVQYFSPWRESPSSNFQVDGFHFCNSDQNLCPPLRRDVGIVHPMKK